MLSDGKQLLARRANSRRTTLKSFNQLGQSKHIKRAIPEKVSRLDFHTHSEKLTQKLLAYRLKTSENFFEKEKPSWVKFDSTADHVSF